jgi:hypothetical protein
MPLSLPVYFLGHTYVLHTRINGRQFKRSLKTADPKIAKSGSHHFTEATRARSSHISNVYLKV